MSKSLSSRASGVMETDAHRARLSEQSFCKESTDPTPAHYLRLLKSHNPNLARLPATKKQKSGRPQRSLQARPLSSRTPFQVLSEGFGKEVNLGSRVVPFTFFP